MSERLDYSTAAVPKNYECYDCEVRGVKLWRQYQTFADNIHLLCLKCACKDQEEVRFPTEDGKSLYTGETHYWYSTSEHRDGWSSGYDPTKPIPVEARRSCRGYFGLLSSLWSPWRLRSPVVWSVRCRWVKFSENRERCDQIGWLVPAVPTEECDTYWGYTSVPDAGCSWWHRLPYFAEV